MFDDLVPSPAATSGGSRSSGLLASAANVARGAAEAAGDIAAGVGDATIALAEGAGANPANGFLANLRRGTDRARNADFGYEEATSWDDVKAAPLRNFVPYALEQGLISLPDMAAAVVALPAYAYSRAGSLADERAGNNGFENATVGDLVKVLPAAVGSALLERFGARGAIGVDDVARAAPEAIGRAAVREGATEAGQAQIEYAATNAGTDAGWEAAESGERSLQGAVAGAGYGGAARAVAVPAGRGGGLFEDLVEGEGAGGPRITRDEPPEGRTGSLDAPSGSVDLFEWPENGKDAPPVPKAAPARQRLSEAEQKSVVDIVRRVSGLAEPQFMETIRIPTTADGLKAWGREGREGEYIQAAGYYDISRDAITIALDIGRDGPRVAHHEAFHRLQRLFLNEQERDLLAGETETLRAFVASDPARAEQAAGMAPIEIEAEAFAIYSERMDRGEKAPIRLKGRIRAAWDRIRATTRRVRNYLGKRGYATYEDVFEPARTGETAKRGDGSRRSPVSLETAADLDGISTRVASPTPAQAEAGNYAKGHARWQGLDIAIETPKGGKRSGTGRDGTAWEVTMPAHYGDFKGTKGADGDPVDVYVGDDPGSDRVFIVDQKDADTGKFDEVKVFVGVQNKATVRRIYRSAFSDGRAADRLQAITETTVDGLKSWLSSNQSQKAFTATKGSPKAG